MAGSLTIDNINGKVISSSPVATESQVIGVGQTWQDVTASRAIATTYTNSTGKPIEVSFFGASSSNSTRFNFYINGVIMGGALNTSGAPVGATMSFIVPNGATYKIQIDGGTGYIFQWSELR